MDKSYKYPDILTQIDKVQYSSLYLIQRNSGIDKDSSQK